MTADELYAGIQRAFAYTGDNNRDLVADASFPLAPVAEEIAVRACADFLSAYIVRNRGIVNETLTER